MGGVVGLVELPSFIPTADMVNSADAQVRADQVANLGAVLQAITNILEQLTESGIVIDLGNAVVTEKVYGLTESVGSSIQAAREDHTHGSPQLSTATPADVGAAGAAGSGTTPSKSDHVHRGVRSIARTAALYGDVTVTGSGGTTVTQAAQNIDIASTGVPALSSTTPADVGSAGAIGVGVTSARDDHVHRGVTSVSKTGAIYGAVTVTQAGGVTITQAGQNLEISSSVGVTDHGALTGLLDPDHPQYLLVADIDDTPVNGEVAQPISSNWAFDHAAAADPHAGYLLESILDAKGDIIGATAADTPARLAVGTDGQVLTGSAAAATGLAWQNPPVFMIFPLLASLYAGAHSLTDVFAAITYYVHIDSAVAASVKFHARFGFNMVAARTFEWRIRTLGGATLLSGSAAVAIGVSTLDVCDTSAASSLPLACPGSARVEVRITVASAGSTLTSQAFPGWRAA